MSATSEFDLVLVVVNKGWSDPVIDTIQKTGGGGATVLHGRGAGTTHIPKLFGIPIEPEKDIVLSAVPAAISARVLEAVSKNAGLDKPNTGIAVILPLKAVAGLAGLMGAGE